MYINTTNHGLCVDLVCSINQKILCFSLMKLSDPVESDAAQKKTDKKEETVSTILDKNNFESF